MFKTSKKEFVFELTFKIMYFVLVLISFNSIFAMQTYLTYISFFITVFGAVVVLNRLTHIKDYINKYTIVLFLFLSSYFISSIVMREYGIVENAKAMVWMTIQYFILFATDKNKSSLEIKKEMDIISIIFIIYTFICSIVGILMMFFNYGIYKIVNDVGIMAGFVDNRLWGVYSDPNYGAVFAVISIFLSIYYLKKLDKTILKTGLIANIIVEFLYICFSDSRTGKAAFICSAFVFVFIELYREGKIAVNKKEFYFSGVKKLFICTFYGLVIASLIFVSIPATLKVANKIKVQDLNQVTGSIFIVNASTMDSNISISPNALYKMETVQVKLDNDNMQIGRDRDKIKSENFTSNRFGIWKSAYEIFKTTPVVGTTFRHINDYAVKNLPETFLAQPGSDFHSMHNFLVDIMVSQGSIGLLLIFAFITFALKDVLTKVKYIKDDDYRLYCFVFSSLTAILVSMMFYSEAFYMNTGGAFLFWTFLGYILNSFLVANKNEVK